MKQHNLSILLVDDNRVNQFVIDDLLRRLEFRVVCASTGEDALKRAAEDSFDLIILDLQLPGIDGFETAQRLKNLGDKAPIIAVSGLEGETTRRQCLEVGIRALLGKPFHPEELYRIVNEHLGLDLNDSFSDSFMSTPREEDIAGRVSRTISERGYSDESRRKMLEIAPREIGDHLHTIIEALGDGNLQLIARETHSLKGSFGALGLTEYQTQTAEIYLAVRLLLYPDEFNIYLDKNGLLFREKEGNHRLFLPGEYGRIPSRDDLARDLTSFFQRGLRRLHSKELQRFIDPEINLAVSSEI